MRGSKGSRLNASKALTWPEEIELWKAGKLGIDNPEMLIFLAIKQKSEVVTQTVLFTKV